jgi:hypothetical protein
MVSNLATAQLAAQAELRGGNLLAFADDNVTSAENDANSVSSTFGSRQPPDARSLALQQKLSQPLSQATSALSQLRTALRDGDRAGIHKALRAVASSLRMFQRLQQGLQ